jgi:hypothetical protein
MRLGLVAVALAAFAAAADVSAAGQEASPVVRPESVDARALVARGAAKSPTIRDLIDRLENGDVTVYVRLARCAGGVPACLLWASEVGRPRRVLIKMDPFGGSPDELTALLAHELEHALDVAESPEIIDLDSFRRSFARRGWNGSAGFETAHARAITKRVAAELGRKIDPRR